MDLWQAAKADQPDELERLIAGGADVAVKGEHGWIPLHWAAMHGCESCVRVLLDAGSNPNAKNNHGCTPEDVASSEPVQPPQDSQGAPTLAAKLTCSLVQVAALLRETRRARHVAFAMGLHPRLGDGAGCMVQVLEPEVLRIMCDAVDGN